MTQEIREATLDILRMQLLNLVTVQKGRGKKLGAGWDRWAKEKCKEPIPDDCDFAVFPGVTSDGLFVLDIELRGVSEEQREKILLSIIEEVFPNALDETLVVKTGNGYHIYLKANDHILRSTDFKKDGMTLEIKGQGKYVIGPSSKHYDNDADGNYFLSGKTYEVISNTTKIKEVNAENFINSLISKGWVGSGSQKPVSELYENLHEKGEGSNRQGDLIRILSSLKIKNPEFIIEDLRYHGFAINSQFMVPYTKGIVEQKIKVSWSFANDVLDNRTQQILEENGLFRKLWGKPEEPPQAATALVTVMIKVGFMVVKSQIQKKLLEWCRLHVVNPVPRSKDLNRAVKIIVDGVWSDGEKFQVIKKVCHDMGVLQKPITFDKDQIAEAGEWVMGRFHVKRLGLTGESIYFNERHYDRDSREFIAREVSQCLINHNNTSVKEVIGYIERTTQIIDDKMIEEHSHLKCLLNGTYDIKTSEFVDSFDPDNIILNLIPHNFDESQGYGEIKRIVGEIIPDEQDRQTYYDFGSTCLHPYTGIDTQLGLVGIPGSGKGQLGELFTYSFGEDNVSHSPIHSIAHDDTIQQDVAYNFLNIDEDLSNQDIKNLDVLKKWITQDKFTGRPIYVHSATFRPSTRLMFMANSIYEIANPDDALAIYERTNLLKANEKFRGEKREVKKIIKKVEGAEFSGFVTYLLKNASEIYGLQNIHHPQKTEDTERLWNEYGNEIHKFIEEWIEFGDTNKCQAGSIWGRWWKYAMDKKIPPGGRNRFYEKFNKIMGMNASQVRDGVDSYYGYVGIKVKTIDEAAEQERIDKTPKGGVLKCLEKLGEQDDVFNKIEELLP